MRLIRAPLANPAEEEVEEEVAGRSEAVKEKREKVQCESRRENLEQER